MKRTTIFIPEQLEADLQHYARRTKKSAAWVVREAVATFLASQSAPPALPGSVGKGDSGRDDVSERFEELLFGDLTATGGEAEAVPRKSSRGSRGARARRAK